MKNLMQLLCLPIQHFIILQVVNVCLQHHFGTVIPVLVLLICIEFSDILQIIEFFLQIDSLKVSSKTGLF